MALFDGLRANVAGKSASAFASLGNETQHTHGRTPRRWCWVSCLRPASPRVGRGTAGQAQHRALCLDAGSRVGGVKKKDARWCFDRILRLARWLTELSKKKNFSSSRAGGASPQSRALAEGIRTCSRWWAGFGALASLQSEAFWFHFPVPTPSVGVGVMRSRLQRSGWVRRTA